VGNKRYIAKNVWDAAQERLAFIFREFENIYVSFSGGKDSGLLLNLVLDYKRRHGMPHRIGLFHQDFEAQYDLTTQYVTRAFGENLADIEPFWFCVPMAVRCAVSNYQMWWHTWDEEKRDAWVRPMPDLPWIISETNGNLPSFYRHKMLQEDVYRGFGPWFHAQRGGGKTIGLLGIRSDESLNRYRAYANDVKEVIGGHNWTTKMADDLYVGYPLYDWGVEDVWTANGKRGFDYNRLYDLFYKAGLQLHQMRVASPFMEYARHSLNLYRVLEPETWVRLCSRVQGANFAAIYGGTKALGARTIQLPKGHTWKSYTKFLLATLPDEARRNYIDKFKTSIRFWHKTGGVQSRETVEELKRGGYRITLGKPSKRTDNDKPPVTFQGALPDHTDDVLSTLEVPSWKRMCFCILKNDHLCKHMGFTLTKQQMDRRKAVIEKYKDL